MTIVDSAKSYVGKVSYSFGAANVKGGVGDCSSFTQQVYKENGVDIGRDTRTQWTKGTEVSKDNLKAGDLVFFQNTYRKGVSHVGIYVGNGQFIHNSDGVGVTYGNLNDNYYKQHWLGGRRVANDGTVNKENAAKTDTNKEKEKQRSQGSTVNPTVYADEVTYGKKKGFLWENVTSVVIILILGFLAFKFFMQVFGGTIVNIALDTVTKGATKGAKGKVLQSITGGAT